MRLGENRLIMYLHVPRKLMVALPLVRTEKPVKKPKQLRRLLLLTKDRATQLWMPTLTSLRLSYHRMPESRREKATLQPWRLRTLSEDLDGGLDGCAVGEDIQPRSARTQQGEM